MANILHSTLHKFGLIQNMHYIFVNYISASIYSDVVMIVFNNLKLYLGKFIIYGNYDTLSGKKIYLEYLFF